MALSITCSGFKLDLRERKELLDCSLRNGGVGSDGRFFLPAPGMLTLEEWSLDEVSFSSSCDECLERLDVVKEVEADSDFFIVCSCAGKFVDSDKSSGLPRDESTLFPDMIYRYVNLCANDSMIMSTTG